MLSKAFLQILFLRQNNRFLVLLISLVALFIIYPIVQHSHMATLVLNIFFMLILVSAVFAIADSHLPTFITISLAILIILLRWLYYFYNFTSLEVVEHCLNVVFWFFISMDILKFILRQRVITAELIYAALAVYFILGLGWASIYELMEISHPGAFTLPDSDSQTQNFMFQMWYFSMVTLTTLGYGDIAPVTMLARVFVVLEAIMGQFYLAVLIASLVGRSISQTNDQ